MTDRVDVLIRNLKFMASAAAQGGYQSDEEIDDSYKILNDGIRTLAAENERLLEQIDRLADVILKDFGGPTHNEGACDTAIRKLRTLAAENERLRELIDRLRVIVARHLISPPEQSSPCTCDACRWVKDAQGALEGE